MASDRVNIFEVGPRDGLQNEPLPLSLKDRVWFISSLVEAGLKDIEVGAFVRTDRVPQMADTDELCTMLFSDKNLMKSSRGRSLARCYDP